MVTQQDILAAIDESNQRLHNIADQLRAQPNAPVHEGNWTIREMLCHVAASSNYATLFERIQQRGGAFPTPDALDEANAQQLATRTDCSVDDLLEETTRGFAEARESARALTDEELAKRGPSGPDGEPITIGDVVMIVHRHHALSHIATLEQAIGTTI